MRGSRREAKTNLDHNEIILNDTISNETSHRGNRFDSDIEFSSSTRFIFSFTDSVNLLVEPADLKRGQHACQRGGDQGAYSVR